MIIQTETGALITRDLIGIDCTKELDLDGHVPFGFEKHLDLKSGTVYLERRKSSYASQSFEQKYWIENYQTSPKLQELNKPAQSATSITLFDDPDLELKLDSSSSSSSSSPSPYQSVSTLGKVKFALERVEKEVNKKRSISMSESCVSPESNSSSSIKGTMADDHNKDDGSSEAYAAGCPNCLLYVLIPQTKPKCPRCQTVVPSPRLSKKLRIDLNIMI